MESEIKALRTKAYAGCVASVVFPPAIPVCYATAIGIVEGKQVPAMRNALK